MKTKLKISTSKKEFSDDHHKNEFPDEKYIEISASGRLRIVQDEEVKIKLIINHKTKKEAREFITRNKKNFGILISGIVETWEQAYGKYGPLNVRFRSARLTEEAEAALIHLQDVASR